MEYLDTLLLRTALGWQAAGLLVVFVVVARTWGASPRPPGSLMTIDGRGEKIGSVSGGCSESGVQAACATETPAALRDSANEAHRLGLPCGCTVKLVLKPVSAHSLLAELMQACKQRPVSPSSNMPGMLALT